MQNFRNPVTATLLFTLLIILSVNIYENMTSSYDLTYTNATDTEPFASRLHNTTLVSSINQLSIDISEIGASGNPIDLVGNLLSSGLGIIKTVYGVIIFVPQTIPIVLAEYNVPEVVGRIIGIMIMVYVAFILVSAYLQRKV